MSYIAEFPIEDHPPAEVVAWLEANGFADNSWHNDVNPCWTKDRICVWATSAESAKEIGYQFGITALDDDGQHVELPEGREFNDWDSCRLEIEHILEHGWLPV